VSTPTSIPDALPTVVVVGGPAELIEAARQAASVAASARVETAELGSAATIVATCRPFAIVMSEDIFAFDADEFEALARDVHAALIRVDIEGADAAKLERKLMPQLGRAHRRHGG